MAFSPGCAVVPTFETAHCSTVPIGSNKYAGEYPSQCDGDKDANGEKLIRSFHVRVVALIDI